MNPIAIQTRQILLAAWKLSTRAVRRLDGWVSIYQLTLLAACLVGADCRALGEEPVVIAPDGTVKINGVVIAPDGTVKIKGTVITPDGKVTINGMVIEPSGNATINGSLKLAANAEQPATAGTIRWTGKDFEGYDGKKWLTLTAAVTPVENMVWIRSGEFLFGTTKHNVKTLITQGFWMGQYEVTQKDYEAVIGSNPSHFKGNEKLPVESVSWNDAVIYCAKLTIRERKAGRIPFGYEYRLPTSAEWEYACRAGKTNLEYTFGDDEKQLGEYDWFKHNADGKTHPVGGKKKNEWGLYDIHGNVSEWCQDYHWGYVGSSRKINPKQEAEFGLDREIRGGTFQLDADDCRINFFDFHKRLNPKDFFTGFRIVLSPRQP